MNIGESNDMYLDNNESGNHNTAGELVDINFKYQANAVELISYYIDDGQQEGNYDNVRENQNTTTTNMVDSFDGNCVTITKK